MIIHIKNTIDYIDFDGTPYLSFGKGLSFQIESLKELQIGESVDLWLYMILKEVEGKMDLKFYSFSNKMLIQEFERFMSISGVGPRMAYSILKNMSREDIIEVVRNGDFQTIKKIPGIGDKLAKRIILELSRIYSKDDDILDKMQKGALTDDQNEILGTLTQMGFDKTAILNSLKSIDINLSKKEMLKEVLTSITQNAKR